MCSSESVLRDMKWSAEKRTLGILQSMCYHVIIGGGSRKDIAGFVGRADVFGEAFIIVGGFDLAVGFRRYLMANPMVPMVKR